MTSRLSVVIVECRHPGLLADFWCSVLGYERGNAGDGWQAIEHPHDDAAPVMAFVVAGDSPGGKRFHVDVTPVDASQEEEVERLVGLGARHVEAGAGGTGLVTLADPERNEFCVMPGTAAGAGAPPG